VPIPQKKGGPILFSEMEHPNPRPDTDSGIAFLKTETVVKPTGQRIPAGNASGGKTTVHCAIASGLERRSCAENATY